MQVIDWLTGLPVFVLFVVMIGFWLIVGFVMWWLVDRFGDREVLTGGRESIARVLTIVASFYVFLLGFIIYEEWNNFTETRSRGRGSALARNRGLLILRSWRHAA